MMRRNFSGNRPPGKISRWSRAILRLCPTGWVLIVKVFETQWVKQSQKKAIVMPAPNQFFWLFIARLHQKTIELIWIGVFNELVEKMFKKLRVMPPKATVADVQFNAPQCPQLGQ